MLATQNWRPSEVNKKTVWVPGAEISIEGKYDICILGSGPSGVAAAVSCAQEGKSVVLIERHGYLGGASTSHISGIGC